MADQVYITDPITSSELSLGSQPTANSVPVCLANDSTSIPVFETASNYQTYAAAVNNLVPAASATDIVEIDGASTGPFTIRPTQIVISATQTTSGYVNVSLIKRSTLNTGGTFTTVTPVQYDDSSSASVSAVKGYTANPTLGTSQGTIMSFKMWVPAATVAGQPFIMTFGTRITQQIFLYQNESLCVNLGGKTVAGGSFDVSIEWTEWY